jgi:acetyltransferase-like isoleucine patch superfamily enzyme
MGQYLKKIQSDAWGYAFFRLRWLVYNINRYYYSAFMRICTSLKKIKIGAYPAFYGKTYFNRFPESVITIGNRCIFDSSKFYNLIGVNRCCIIATLSKQAQLYIGNSIGFSGVRIGCAEKITIGDNCLIGANVTITDSDWHAIDPARRHDVKATLTRPVKIGNNVFIGANSIVLKGTEIGDDSVIGAGSVVSGMIPANVIAAGNPCIVIKPV